jgi:hypothetical protein
VFDPTEDELAEAARLEIDGADRMSGPELREAIKRARRVLRARREGQEEYRKWVAMCTAMGIEVPSGRNAPKLEVLRRQYAERLPAALIERGIIEGATLRIPPNKGLARSGRARVGKVWPITGQMDHITITLQFQGVRAHPYDAWLVWRHATAIRRPQGN